MFRYGDICCETWSSFLAEFKDALELGLIDIDGLDFIFVEVEDGESVRLDLDDFRE